jgi:hypothetical protein
LRALFVFSVDQHARELHPVVADFLKRGDDVHVLIGWSGRTADAYGRQASALSASVVHTPQYLRYAPPTDGKPEPEQPAPAAAPASLVGRLRSRLGLAGYSVFTFARVVREALAARRFAESIIEQLSPDVVFGSNFRATRSVDRGIAVAVNKRGIPYCCIPYSPYVGERMFELIRASYLELGFREASLRADHSLWNRIVSSVFPGWARELGAGRVFVFPTRELFAGLLAGTLAEDPWYDPAAEYDITFVESEYSRDLLSASSYPPARIVVAGKPILDAVFARLGDDEYEGQLYADLRLAPRTPFLLYNVEPMYEHDYATWDEHWEHFRALMDCMQRTGHPVVLSLHPLCNPENYRFVEPEYGFVLATHRLAELCPYSGMIVSYPSSTNPLAAIFDKPLVVYDWLGLARPPTVGHERWVLPGARITHSVDELYDAVIETELRPFSGGVMAARVPSTEVIRRELAARFGLGNA